MILHPPSFPIHEDSDYHQYRIGGRLTCMHQEKNALEVHYKTKLDV
jgi:hypothetical protein